MRVNQGAPREASELIRNPNTAMATTLCLVATLAAGCSQSRFTGSPSTVTVAVAESSSGEVQVAVELDNELDRRRLVDLLNQIKVSGPGRPLSEAADMPVFEIAMHAVFSSGEVHRVLLNWGDEDSGAIVFDDSVFSVVSGLRRLRKQVQAVTGFAR